MIGSVHDSCIENYDTIYTKDSEVINIQRALKKALKLIKNVHKKMLKKYLQVYDKAIDNTGEMPIHLLQNEFQTFDTILDFFGSSSKINDYLLKLKPKSKIYLF